MSTTTVSEDAEDGRGGRNGQQANQGRLWDMDQRIDQPLGAEADHVRSMYRDQVRRAFAEILSHFICIKHSGGGGGSMQLVTNSQRILMNL